MYNYRTIHSSRYTEANFEEVLNEFGANGYRLHKITNTGLYIFEKQTGQPDTWRITPKKSKS